MEEALKKNQDLARQYQELLYPEGHLVAVKLLKNQKEIDALGQVKHADGRSVFCALLTQAWYLGRARLVEANDQACYSATRVLGLGELTDKAAWKRYVGWQFKTEEAARKAYETTPMFPVGTYKAAFISPLERCPVAPDLVVFFGNPSQMLVVIAGYLADRGGTFTMESNNNASCAAIVVAPMLEKRPKVMIPGNALRLLGLPNVNYLACGIPGAMMESLAENMRFLRDKGGSRYPPAWQHIQWTPQPPIADLLKPVGGDGTWARK
jgi:uncharacterized protein (DUF169 family)